MHTRLILATLHLLALAVGLAGVWGRARALRHTRRDPVDALALTRAFTSDTWWGIAAVLWLATGVWRLLDGTEKSVSYYMANQAFHLKMGLFLAILLLEIWPMMTLIRWRRNKARSNARDAERIGVISYVQSLLVTAMVVAAVAMARGYGVKGEATLPASPVPPAAAPADSAVVPRDSAVVSQPIPLAPRADSAPILPEASAVPPVTPSGVETMTPDDLTLLSRQVSMPLDGVAAAALKSNFAERRGGGTRPHEALDIMAARGTPVRSIARGRVLRLFNSKPGGLMVYATDSTERFIILYGHLNGYEPSLKDGAPLARGQVIGYVGSTGNASAAGPHLHMAILRSADVRQWSKGEPIDPLPVLQAAALPPVTRR